MYIEAEIRGNKFLKEEINSMLEDYIEIGKYVYLKNVKKINYLIKEFSVKYKNKGLIIVSKKKNLKQFLNSAKSMYRLAEFFSCNNDLNTYDKYIFELSKIKKGSKVTLYFKEEKELAFVFKNISSFLEFWFIYSKMNYLLF